MDVLTPAVILQIVVTVGAVAAGYGMLRADLKNIARSLDLERQERQNHINSDETSFHDIRGNLQEHHGRLSRIEGQHDLAERIAAALREGR